MPAYITTHPRTKKQLKKFKTKSNNSKIIFHKPFSFLDYINLQRNAYCTISDSGTITEESSILNFPAITIRNSHERPEGMDSGVLIMSGLNKIKVLSALDQVILSRKFDDKEKIIDYGNNQVSDQVSKVIFSYRIY